MGELLERDVDIRMQIARDYEQGIVQLVAGDVDFSNLGPASYVEAKLLDQQISIVAVEKLENSMTSYGIIAVHTDSNIQSVDDLRGQSFAFGDEGSTIGRFLSQQVLVQAGILRDDLDTYEYLGRHDKVGTAVGAGAFDAGALNYQTFNRLKDAGHPIRELLRFPSVSKPWIARSGLPDTVLEAMRASFKSVKSSTALTQLDIDGFGDGSDAEFEMIRQAIQNNEAFYSEPGGNTYLQKNNDIATNPVSEPVIQAAVSESSDNTVSPDVPHTDNDLIIIESVNTPISLDDNGQHKVSIDISLPKTLFTNGRYHGPDTLNISVKILNQIP